MGLSTFFYAGTLSTNATRTIQPPAGETWAFGSGLIPYSDAYIQIGIGAAGSYTNINQNGKDVYAGAGGTSFQFRMKYWFNNTYPLRLQGSAGGTSQYTVTGTKLPTLSGATLIRKVDLNVAATTGKVAYIPPAGKVWVLLSTFTSTLQPYVTDGTNTTSQFNIGALNADGLGCICTPSLYWGFVNGQGNVQNFTMDILEIDANQFPATVGQLVSVAAGSEMKMQAPAGETWRIHSPPVEPNSFYVRGYEAGVMTYNPMTVTNLNWSPTRCQYVDNQSYPAIYNFSGSAKWYGYLGYKLP